MSLWNCAAWVLAVGAGLSVGWAQERGGQQPPDPGTAASPTGAPNANPTQEDEVDSIVVRGNRIAGATIGDIEPELSLVEAEIQAYGASTFADLLAALEPETSSGRGRGGAGGGGGPIILLNGVRVANFGEIRRYPTEALARVDVLPEETAVQYGYRADQRVVNFVLKPGFKSLSAEIESEAPTAGGRHTLTTELGWLQFGENRRTSLDGEHSISSSLLERERGVVSSVPALPYDLLGNIGGMPFGDEIDPALSALTGDAVTLAALPVGTDLSRLELTDFVEGAGVPNTTALGDFRTLLPEQEQVSVTATHNRTVFDTTSLTISAKYDRSDSESFLGLAGYDVAIPARNLFSPFAEDIAFYRYLDPSRVLMREATSEELNGALTIAGNKGEWRYNVIADADRATSTTTTDRSTSTDDVQARVDAGDVTLNPFDIDASLIPVSRDLAETTNDTVGVDATLNGFVTEVPAGRVSATLRANVRSRSFTTESVRSGNTTRVELSRDTAVLRGNVDIPIADADAGVLPLFGELDLDLRAEVEDISDVGTLTTYGAGLRWTPVDPLRFTASWRREDGAPSITQLGNPLVETPNVRVFDFSTGQTVEVVQRSGGNAELRDDTRDVLALGARWELREEPDITLSTDYTDERITDPIAAFPALTAEIEAAFPDRFVRDAGELVLVDVRPVNFQESARRELRTGLSFRKRLASNAQGGGGGRPPFGPGGAPRGDGARPERPPAEATSTAQSADAPPSPRAQGTPPPAQSEGAPAPAARPSGAPPSGAGGRPGGGRPGGGFGGSPFGGGGGFLSASLFHTWYLEQTITIRDGVPVLDLLDGSAVGSLGGQPEHQVQGNLFFVLNGYGARGGYRWQDGTRVDGDPLSPGGEGDLEFSSLGTAEMRVWINFDQRKKTVEKYPFLKGARIALDVENIFDEKLSVRDAFGEVPINYQPDLIDPVGRTIEVSFRKLLY